jgi:hypothetical protein
MIRGLSLALLASVEPWMAIASAQTGISQYPYCAQGADNPGWSGCSYNTMGARQADASGTDSECLANPCIEPVEAQRHSLGKDQLAPMIHFPLVRHQTY